MYEYLIYNQLKKYARVSKSFHMPGHKGQGEFKKMFPVADLDVTELTYSDNLACADGVIAAAQCDIAKILGAARSYILTDGSSLGVFAMVYCASKRGKKIIVPRNCHQSVWNACRLLGLEPIVLHSKMQGGVMLPPEPSDVERAILKEREAVGLLVTSPDYFGNIAPLEEYAKILKSNGGILMVDGAHGGHLAFEPKRCGYAGLHADIWVDGAHKTLATLTQGAILNVNNLNLISDAEEGLSLFRTTSPSYPVMASVEYGVKLLANCPGQYAAAKNAVELVKKEGIKTYPSADWTKLALDCAAYGICAEKAAEFFEKRNLYCEFANERYVLFYLSPAITAENIGRLIRAVKAALSNKALAGTYVERETVIPQNGALNFQYALKQPCEWVELDKAIGRTCAQNAGLTPPCTPVCLTGEVITVDAVRTLKSGKTYGIFNGKIKAVIK